MSYDELDGIGEGAAIRRLDAQHETPPPAACIGRVLDALGRPIDGGPPLPPEAGVPLQRRASSPVLRRRVTQPLDLGVRSINALLTVGRGTRIGLMAGSGVGKSTLLGQVARFTEAEVVVLALIGERGREVREFIERELGDALARSVVIVATSDDAAIARRRAAHLAAALAEAYRDQGRSVLLLMDSLTRFCMALREIGLATGEPPATRGYPPSIWAELPKLVERAGTGPGEGEVTGIYTVLVEGDDMNEPIADATRALLDGHVVLSRAIAERGRFPAIDPLASVSRVMPDVTDPAHLDAAAAARRHLAVWRDAEELISIGAYQDGADPAIDEARRRMPAIEAFLAQGRDERSDLEHSREGLARAIGAAS